MNLETSIAVPLLAGLMLCIRWLFGPGQIQHLFSKDGKPSASKIGTVTAIIVYSLKMLGLLPNSPDDPLLWLAFMGTVGGYEIAKEFAKGYTGGKSNNAAAE